MESLILVHENYAYKNVVTDAYTATSTPAHVVENFSGTRRIERYFE